MTNFGTMRPKLIAQIIIIAVMPSAIVALINSNVVAGKQPLALCDQHDGVAPCALAITREHRLGLLAVGRT
jgi:hypothetical protein